MKHNVNRFYGDYWSRAEKPIPDDDPTTEKRYLLLGSALKQFLTASNDASVLDAGCGRGEFIPFIKELGFKVVGIDISSAAIEKARRLCQEAPLYVGSLEDTLPFNNCEFKAIWSTEVLEHLFDVHACLSEFNRVLREGGILILTTPFHGFLKNLAIALVGFEEHFNPYLSHIRFFTKKSLAECLSRAGFEPVLWRGIGRVWPLYKSLFVVARKVKLPKSAPTIIG